MAPTPLSKLWPSTIPFTHSALIILAFSVFPPTPYSLWPCTDSLCLEILFPQIIGVMSYMMLKSAAPHFTSLFAQSTVTNNETRQTH